MWQTLHRSILIDITTRIYRWARHANTIWIPRTSRRHVGENFVPRVCHDQLVRGKPVSPFSIDAVSRYFISCIPTVSSKDGKYSAHWCLDRIWFHITRNSTTFTNTCPSQIIIWQVDFHSSYFCFSKINYYLYVWKKRIMSHKCDAVHTFFFFAIDWWGEWFVFRMVLQK